MKIKNERVHDLGKYAYNIFKLKGNQNAVKVRRIIQLTKDLAQGDVSKLKILDLGCAEGVYALEAALRVASVVAIDGRIERMKQGHLIAKKRNLYNIKFLKQDIRDISIKKLGEFDVIYLLGLLYHLDSSDIFNVLPKLYQICKRLLIIDTHIAIKRTDNVFNNGIIYEGIKVREHQEDDSIKTITSRLSSSKGNIFSFYFTKESLIRLLKETGFTTVLECYVPFEPTEEKIKGDRITLAAIKGNPVKISSYPWLNDLSEERIKLEMEKLGRWHPYWEPRKNARGKS